MTPILEDVFTEAIILSDGTVLDCGETDEDENRPAPGGANG